MEVKKYAKPEVRNKRVDFFLVGLFVSIAWVFFAFTYRQPPPETKVLENEIIEEDLVVMENTVQEKKPPPPPPPPEIEVVEDDEEIEEEQPEIEDMEVDQDTEIEAYEEEEEEEPEETNEVFEIFDVSEKASFPGGELALRKFLAENVTYPQMAMENDMQGTVTVMFVIDKKGRVTDVKTLGGKKGFGLEQEAIRVIKKTSGMWSPAKQRDKSVNMRFRMPVKFQLM